MRLSVFWRKKRKSFFEYFLENAQTINEASKLLKDLFLDNSSSNQISKKIKDLEHHGDLITHDVIKRMNTSGFILPLDREDILTLIKSLDDVIDSIDDSAEVFSEIYCLDKSTDFARRFSDTILQCSEQLVLACSMLSKPARNADAILHSCIEIHRLENVADDLKKEALKELYANLKANEVELATFIAWDEIYRTLEIVTDKAEDCANIAEQIVMKYS